MSIPTNSGYQPGNPQTNNAQSNQPGRRGGLNGFGLTGVILGVVALGISWIPFFGFFGVFLALGGIVFGVLGIALQKYRGRRGLGIAGTVVSGIALVVAAVLPWITGAFFVFNWVGDSGIIDELEQDFESYYEESYEPSETATPKESPTPSATVPETARPTP